MLDRLTGACCTQQTAIRAAKTLKAPPGQPLARFCGCFSCFAQAPPGRVAAGMLQRRALFPRCAARGGGCAAERGFSWRVAAEGGGCAPRRVAAARRSGVPLAGCSGGWWLRGGAGFSLACCSGWCFQCFAPRRVLRRRGARGALRPLFLLRSCAADQEKRPEKKSGAVMACAPVRLERLWGTCIRSTPRCSSRGQREEGIFWLRGRDFGDGFWELGLWKLVLYGGVLSVCCPEGRPRVP